MRTRLGVIITTVVLAALVALPDAAGAAAAFTVTRTPSGGPDGTTITLNGTCGANNQVTAMLHNKDSDASSVDGQGTFPVGAGGSWHGTLKADLHGQTAEQDLDLSVTCGPDTQALPFFATAKTTNNPPTVLTALAQDGCAQFAPGSQYIPCPPHVKGFNNDVLTQTNFYADNGTGGASVAVGDVEGNGTPDIVVGSGPGHSPMVWVFKQTGTFVTSFVPYDPNFKGGVNVAVGDVTGDRKAEIVTGAGSGGGPHVRIFDGSGNPIGPGFMAYDPAFHGGVNVAVGDTDNDGMGEIVTGAGPGGGPHVRVFDGSGNALGGGFFAYDPHFVGGVSVAAGTNRIVTGAGRGGGPHVRLFDGAGNPSGGGFFAYDGAFLGGVWVALGPNGIVTGPGSGGGPDVRAFSLSGSKTDEFLAYEAAFTAGVKVAALGTGGGSSSTTGPGGTTTSNPGGVTITHPSPGGTFTSIPGGSTTSG